MFKKMLTTLSLACIAFCLNAQTAQDALSKLTFEAPQALYHAKGESANMRQQPNMKSRKVAGVNQAYILNDEGNNAQWITTHFDGKQAFASKSVMTKIDPQPFMVNKMQNAEFVCDTGDYDYGIHLTWRIGKIKGNSNLWLCQTRENNDEMGYARHTLRLGKMIGNVLVFKYCIEFNFYDNGTINKCNVESEINNDYPYNGKKVYYLAAGQDLKYKNESEVLDLTKVTEPMVYSLFKEVIDHGETNYFYLTSYNFGKQWIPEVY